MKKQWSLLLVIFFALIVAVFAVINVEPVEVDYLFGQSQWPLILIVLGSVLMGALMAGYSGMNRIRSLKKENKALKRELDEVKTQPAHKEPLPAEDPVHDALLPSRTERNHMTDNS
ncbi:lipopolysaccharide assembly LapA domain-containing protein [Metabacillus sp. FJAT-52054]|uniref:Lipopolysaccharide assembly LapA domain-containing protein n=1 Tax=Metabacillus sediminis TaxID=3117746 RepID=A0ABZ2NDU7_9BACI